MTLQIRQGEPSPVSRVWHQFLAAIVDSLIRLRVLAALRLIFGLKLQWLTETLFRISFGGQAGSPYRCR